MQQTIITYQGKDTGRTIDLPSRLFDAAPNEHLVYLAIKHYLANQRQGTHKTKQKGEVRASTRKLIRQKGTGNARKGSAKSNILRGGGRTFGPQPRTYATKLNKKESIKARISALSHRARNKNIIVLEDFELEAPKTKAYLAMLHKLGMQDQKTLLVLAEPGHNILLAAKNLPKARISTPSQLNTYDILYAQTLLLMESSIQLIEQKLC